MIHTVMMTGWCQPQCTMKLDELSLTFNKASIWPFKNAESSDIACSFLSTCSSTCSHWFCHRVYSIQVAWNVAPPLRSTQSHCKDR